MRDIHQTDQAKQGGHRTLSGTSSRTWLSHCGGHVLHADVVHSRAIGGLVNLCTGRRGHAHSRSWKQYESSARSSLHWVVASGCKRRARERPMARTAVAVFVDGVD